MTRTTENHTDEQRGIYNKFRVERVDGSPKHEGCEYFVLDIDHDPHALVAIKAYEESLRRSGQYSKLAHDLQLMRHARQLRGMSIFPGDPRGEPRR